MHVGRISSGLEKPEEMVVYPDFSSPDFHSLPALSNVFSSLNHQLNSSTSIRNFQGKWIVTCLSTRHSRPTYSRQFSATHGLFGTQRMSTVPTKIFFGKICSQEQPTSRIEHLASESGQFNVDLDCRCANDVVCLEGNSESDMISPEATVSDKSVPSWMD